MATDRLVAELSKHIQTTDGAEAQAHSKKKTKGGTEDLPMFFPKVGPRTPSCTSDAHDDSRRPFSVDRGGLAARGAAFRANAGSGRQFLWLVRDFSLKLVANGHEISPKEYLENSLQPIEVGPARPKRLRPRASPRKANGRRVHSAASMMCPPAPSTLRWLLVRRATRTASRTATSSARPSRSTSRIGCALR